MVFPSLTYGQPARPLRVLVADDNRDTADSLAELLAMAGCEAEVAYDGSAVVPAAVRFGPDVCVLDVRMPGVDGWEVARRLRAGVGGRGLLLIAVTGVQGKAAADLSCVAGFDHHILKPARPEEIFSDLAAFIGRSPVVPPVCEWAVAAVKPSRGGISELHGCPAPHTPLPIASA